MVTVIRTANLTQYPPLLFFFHLFYLLFTVRSCPSVFLRFIPVLRLQIPVSLSAFLILPHPLLPRMLLLPFLFLPSFVYSSSFVIFFLFYFSHSILDSLSYFYSSICLFLSSTTFFSFLSCSYIYPLLLPLLLFLFPLVHFPADYYCFLGCDAI
jgi:hypothetical protein